MATAEELGVTDVEEVLRNLYGLEGEIYRDEFRTLCPVHSEDRPSCEVNLKTGYWNCWSCPGRGDLVSLGCIVIEGMSMDAPSKRWRKPRQRIRKLLRPNNPDTLLTSIQARTRNRRRELLLSQTSSNPAPSRTPVPPWGSYKSGPLDELHEKGLTRETLERWGVRYAKSEQIERLEPEPNEEPFFTIKHSIAIPILSEIGTPFAWCYRATRNSDSWQPRFIYTPDPTPPLYETWFGMHHHRNASEVAIVEGTTDAMKCDQFGIPALAIMGSNVSVDQGARKVEWLSRFRHVTIMTDHDDAGARAAITIAVLLRKRGIACRISRYHRWMTNPSGEPAKDPGEMCKVDLELLYERAVPYQTWLLSQRRADQQDDDDN